MHTINRTLSLLILICVGSLAAIPSASAITIDWSPIGNAGNAADPATGFGAVDYNYRIGTYDVTNSQYVAFLNSNDPTGADPLGLYNSQMSNPADFGGISYNSGAGQRQQVQRDFRRRQQSCELRHLLRHAPLRQLARQWPGPRQHRDGCLHASGRNARRPAMPDSITRNTGATVFLPERKRMVQGCLLQPGHQHVLSVCHGE